jgi:hypothetical protein
MIILVQAGFWTRNSLLSLGIISLGDWNVVAGNSFDFVYLVAAFVIFCVTLSYCAHVLTGHRERLMVLQ